MPTVVKEMSLPITPPQYLLPCRPLVGRWLIQNAPARIYREHLCKTSRKSLPEPFLQGWQEPSLIDAAVLNLSLAVMVSVKSNGVVERGEIFVGRLVSLLVDSKSFR